jgi:phosphoglycerol transferase MdoB-like AlkP superfamily enzyme
VTDRRSAFWPAFWLAVVMAGCKATHWSLPEPTLKRMGEYVVDIGVSAHQDILFAVAYGLLGYALLGALNGRARAQAWVWRFYLAVGFACAVFAVASIQIFAYLRSPLTYALLYLADNMTNMRSSIGAFVSVPVAIGLVVVPLLWSALIALSLARDHALPQNRGRFYAAGGVALAAYAFAGHRAYEGRWHDRDDHLIAKSPHWALVASYATELLGLAKADRFQATYPADYRADFQPPRKPAGASKLPNGPRPRNVILVVLESVGANYMGLYGSRYPTTPTLSAEAAHALVYDAFYCHMGLTANSEAALTLSIYPYMTWREYTIEYPEMPGHTLAQVLRPRGYRTAFIHSGDLNYTNQRAFLDHRGFEALWDWRDLGAPIISSWGTHDAALVDGVLKWLDREPGKPFFALAWTTQSHHPYEPTPDVPLIDFFKGGPLPEDDYDLGRYLNTLHYTDRELQRLFAGLRERGLADDTLVVVTGDHGEAFGEPHNAWGHGSRVFEENVRVPLMIWNPRLFGGAGRSPQIGGHVDLNPTIADVLGVPPAPDWRGRSLFDPRHPGRAYFYAANDDYLLGVREGRFKYIYNATRGRDELYDLAADPLESKNLARDHPEVCQRLRSRLAAWRDDAGEHLAHIRAAGSTASR